MCRDCSCRVSFAARFSAREVVVPPGADCRCPQSDPTAHCGADRRWARPAGGVCGRVGADRGRRTPEQVMDSPVPQIIENSLPFAPQEHVQYRVPEQAVGVLVPLITEDGLPIVPQERVLNRVVEQISGVPVPQIKEDGLPTVSQERVQNRTQEQIICFLEPQVMEDGLPAVPQECVQNRTSEELVDVPVPQIMEAIAENHFPEQIVNSPVPQIVEAVAGNCFPEQIVNSTVPQFFEAIVENRVGEQIVDSPVPLFMGEDVETEISAPQESVQNHTLEQVVDFPTPPNMEVYAGRVRAIPQERVPVMDVPLPHIKQGAVSTGKVFTVKLRHHRDDHASSDNVGFIKGLDKHNMPRFGDVMVPPPQINKVSWFDRKPQAAADEPLYRFYQRYSGRSGRSKLKR